ncbi:histidine phosphatase family protein (plasmid) [Clostridium estertheticum]|uniref:histidine phosphatase family protein n=1 Tax=Clostridium estertheticum TaxID=238834 RepID=UPI001C7E1B00|nr:histidine phosphatase family protein [Clostridium estertheticum]MBX4262862.1 histidine phosphatase family protein [Clostridium estertheticum]WLC73220.1 histidine phosphatase family protein [Clostridium estertheticum]
MRKIVVIQHCQSEHHINNMTGGCTDTPLTELGRNQAELIGLKLKKDLEGESYTIYSSDLMRAKQTADIVAKHLNLNVIEEMDLREINTGVAAGKTKDWAKEHRNPRLSKEFDLDYQEFQDGETWRQFYIRACECMKKICDLDKGNIIIVTHGCTLSYIIAWWMNFEFDMLGKAFFSAQPGSISVLQQNNYKQNVLTLLNDRSHLSGL